MTISVRIRILQTFRSAADIRVDEVFDQTNHAANQTAIYGMYLVDQTNHAANQIAIYGT